VDENRWRGVEGTRARGGRMGLANGGYGISWGRMHTTPTDQGPIAGTSSTPCYVLWLKTTLECPSLGR